jgi:hypothetical protein
LKKKEQIPTVVLYRHPHHIEMQKSSRQGHVHQHMYALAGQQTGNRSRGAWKTTNTMGRAQASETIPWQPRHDAEKDKGAKVAIMCTQERDVTYTPSWFKLHPKVSQYMCSK